MGLQADRRKPKRATGLQLAKREPDAPLAVKMLHQKQLLVRLFLFVGLPRRSRLTVTMDARTPKILKGSLLAVRNAHEK